MDIWGKNSVEEERGKLAMIIMEKIEDQDHPEMLKITEIDKLYANHSNIIFGLLQRIKKEDINPQLLQFKE
jgi:hypothetical protein